MIAVLAVLTAVSTACKKESNEDKLYRQLIKESKKDGLSSLLADITPDNIGQLLKGNILFSSGEEAAKFEDFVRKIYFIRYTDLYPSLENLINVAFSDEVTLPDERDRDFAKHAALFILASEYTQLEKDKPSKEQVKKHLKNCDSADIYFGILLLTRIDKEEGFHFADKIINDENVSLVAKVVLSVGMIPFEYTGGYVILNEAAKYVKLNETVEYNALNEEERIAVATIDYYLPVMMEYYSLYNGQFATNTEIVIDTTAISSPKETD